MYLAHSLEQSWIVLSPLRGTIQETTLEKYVWTKGSVQCVIGLVVRTLRTSVIVKMLNIVSIFNLKRRCLHHILWLKTVKIPNTVFGIGILCYILYYKMACYWIRFVEYWQCLIVVIGSVADPLLYLRGLYNATLCGRLRENFEKLTVGWVVK